MLKGRSSFLIFSDIIILIGSFTLVAFLKPYNKETIFNLYLDSLSLFMLIWITTSFIVNKYKVIAGIGSFMVLRKILVSNLIAFGIIAILMYTIRIWYFSRMVVLGTVGMASILEILVWSTYYAFINANNNEPLEEVENFKPTRRKKRQAKTNEYTKEISKQYGQELKTREEAVLVELMQEAFHYIFQFANIESPKCLIVNTISRFNILAQLQDKFDSIVNLKRINDIRYINKFFEVANHKLGNGGLFIDFVETKNLRKKRILNKFPPIINWVFYFFDFIIKRVFPKFLLTKKLYFFLTRGENRVFTKAETFGRLYSCGFEVIDEKRIGGHLYFIARKTSDPHFPEHPSYGPLIKLLRVGKGGELIKVYKMRTMHPYAEFLQDYIYKTQGLQEGGKFKKDFRVSTVGRILRTFWLDELPMIINLLRGELKIVGVRPLSQHYFELYPKEFQERRIKYKPGLVPPFYVDNPKTLEDVIESERKYLNAYDKHPFFTDIKYFFLAFYNIIFRRLRSA